MTIAEQAVAMLPDVKNYLDVSWVDPEGDKKLSGILQRGMKRINGNVGKESDYAEEGRARELLFEYARYARSNALDEWENAFLSEILFLAHQVQIEAMPND